MGTQVNVCCHFPEYSQIQSVHERLKHMLWHAVNVIASCREAQARRRIQLYLDDRLIDEFEQAGKRIAKKDVNDRCNS